MQQSDRIINYWLLSVFFTISLMVAVGGITRLTRSGLSIVEWRPVTGIVPPLNEQEWQAEFDKYRQFPEFQKVNREMSLSEFKGIFFWEYFHRLIGRLIGFLFLIPFLYFLFTQKIRGPMIAKTFGAFFLGGLQGLMGWYMVKSGLVNLPRVSHYRLAAHLLLAFLILQYILWLVLDNWNRGEQSSFSRARLKKFRITLVAILSAVVVQIVYGAFTAGLRAGYGYNTFPMMGETWIPDSMFLLEPTILNFFENNVTVQFLHRYIGWGVLIAIFAFRFALKKETLTDRERLAANLLVIGVVIQFLLGVTTLVLAVPISVAVIHQVGASLLLSLSLFAFHTFYRAVPQE